MEDQQQQGVNFKVKPEPNNSDATKSDLSNNARFGEFFLM